MASVFSRIVKGEIPAYKVHENADFLAFLDINPLATGHTLVIPKQEVDYIFDISNDLLGRMIVFAKDTGLAIEKAIPCKRIGIAVIGLEVPHAHIHLIPLNSMQDINFSRPKMEPSKEELERTAALIRQHLS
jgi:histidine triad (HIT) family protein